MPYFSVFEIKAGETRTLTVDFDGRLPAGVAFTGSGHTVGAVDFYSRQTDNTVLALTTPTISGTDASAVVRNVLLGERYEVTFVLTLDDATPSVIKETVLVIGVEKLS